jgi:hypothetical protein
MKRKEVNIGMPMNKVGLPRENGLAFKNAKITINKPR